MNSSSCQQVCVALMVTPRGRVIASCVLMLLHSVAAFEGVAHRLISSRARTTCVSLSLGRPREVALGTLAAAGLALGAANSCFGILDQTADELADILGVDDVPPAVVRGVLAARPLYEPLKAASPSCTEALFPEFNSLNDFNDCLLLQRRIIWRGGLQAPLVIDQSMRMGSMWQQSTGSSVWGGGVVLARYMEGLGGEYWAGKRVLELGSGSGVGAITAVKLGARTVLATDRDAAVLQLALRNAATNLGERKAILSAERLEWGEPSAAVDATQWDVVIGADLTCEPAQQSTLARSVTADRMLHACTFGRYNRESWPYLIAQLQRLHAPAILSASEPLAPCPCSHLNLRNYELTLLSPACRRASAVQTSLPLCALR